MARVRPLRNRKKKQYLVRSTDYKAPLYRGADKSLAQPISRYILFDGENISFDASRVIYINSTNISPIILINRIYGNQNLLSL
jgi:homoserine trans-succinylase